MRKSIQSVAISGALLLVACSGPRPPWATRDDAAVTSPPTSEAATLAIHGRVVDARNTPVPGALVAAVGPEGTALIDFATTAADGTFAFALRPGPWAFTATSARGVPRTRTCASSPAPPTCSCGSPTAMQTVPAATTTSS